MATLAGRHAIVSGAGSGIGRATALALAAAGARVTATDIDLASAQDTVAFIHGQGGEALALRCDASRAEDHRAAVHTAVDALGPLHIACNNAGISGGAGGGYKPLAEVDPRDWQQMLDVNLSGVFHGLQAQIPALLAAGGGSIVNIASVMAQAARPGLAAYVAAKHGVLGLTRAAAMDYAARGVRVNAIGPGYIDTPMLAGRDAAGMEAVSRLHPMGRLGKAEEVAALVVWLSGAGAGFVTGAYYPVDGGFLAQ